MTVPITFPEKCPRCWAYYMKGYDHQCPPLMVALVALHEQRKNAIEPDPILPPEEAL